MKKFRAKIALILVLSLTLAVAIPALAAQSTKITGKFEQPEIEVVIPTTATAVINPYKLPVTVYAEDGKSRIDEVGAGLPVATRPLIGYNASKFPLEISASVVGTPKGDLTLNGTLGSVTTKQSVINFDLKKNDYTTVADTWYYNAAAAKQHKTTAIGQLDGAFVVNAFNNAWTGCYSVQVDTSPKPVKGITVDAANNTGDDSKPVYEPKLTSVFLARLSGEVAEDPWAVDSKGDASTTEKAPWTTRDGVDVTVAWTIKLDPAYLATMGTT